jgi:peptidyl-prolyl cis-trans isomerase SurA
MKNGLILAAGLLILNPILSPSARAVIIEKAVAVVNKQVITLTELQERAILIRKALRNPNISLKDVLRHIVVETIQVQRAKELGLSVPDEVIDNYIENFMKENHLDNDSFDKLLKDWGITLDAYREEVRRRILISKVVNLEVKSRIAVPEEEAREYYDKHKDKIYLLPAKARLADIFIPRGEDNKGTMKKAQDIFQKLQLGESFKKMASLYSQGPNAQEGGDMGWAGKGELMAPLDAFLFSTENKPGDMKLIEAESGMHIVKILEKQEKNYVPFDQVKKDITKKLYQERASKRYQNWLDTLVKKAYVKILL